MVLLVLTLFIGTTLSHAVFLKIASKKKEEERSYFWSVHLLLNSFLWVLVIAGLVFLQFTQSELSFPLSLKLLGFLLIGGGFALAIRSYLLLGWRRIMGIRFFYLKRGERIVSFPYNFLNNPMYDGFFLILLGLGFTSGIQANFYFAFVSFVLLNIFLSRIENYEARINPF